MTRVPPIAGVKLRALVLAEQIERACPGQAVHIIGHSMGGLDARQLLVNPAWSGRILSLTTIGTPHLGSALADYSRLRAGPVYRLLRAMKIKHHGFFDLTRRAAGAVNRNGFAASGVPCFCVAGDPTIDLVCWPLKPFYDAPCRTRRAERRPRLGPLGSRVRHPPAELAGRPPPPAELAVPLLGPVVDVRDPPQVRFAGREPGGPRFRGQEPSQGLRP